MQNPTISQRFTERTEQSPHEEAKFRIVCLYECAITRRAATSLFDTLVKEIGDDCELETTAWNFNELEEPLTQSVASRELKRADMILLSADGSHPVPPQRHHWLDSQLSQKAGQACALVLLLQSAGSTAIDQMRQLAQSYQLDFFCQTRPVRTVETRPEDAEIPGGYFNAEGQYSPDE